MSARDHIGLDVLRDAVGERFAEARLRVDLHLPSAAGRLRARLYEGKFVLDEQVDDSGWALRLGMSRAQAEKLAEDDAWMASALAEHLKRELEPWEQES